MTDKLRQNPIFKTYFCVSIIAPFAVGLLPLMFSGATEQSQYGDYVGTVFLLIMVLPFAALNALIANVIAIAVYKAKSYWAILIIQVLIYALTAYSMFGPSSKDIAQKKAESDLESIYKSNARTGREVPGVAFCPGKRMPDMIQADFDALPVEYRNLYRDVPKKEKLEFLCGQLLNQLLDDDSPAGYRQEDRLRLLDNLLNTKQVARNADGNDNWWPGAASFLKKMNNNDAIAATTRLEFYRLFEQKILPRLRLSGAGDTNSDGISDVVEQTTFMPIEIAMHVLQTLGAQGVLSKESGAIEPSTLAMQVLRNQPNGIGEMPQPVFDYLLTQAGPNAVNDRELMQIAERNMLSVQRLLLAGANPAHDGLLASARSAGWNSIIYQMMLSAALQPDKLSHAKRMLPPHEADLILQQALQNCDAIDWKEIDFLKAHGANIARSFQNDPPQPIAHYATTCPETFKRLVAQGLRMDVAHDEASSR